MRKNLSIIVILASSILYLIQGGIPHHHHEENVICVEKTHCEEEENPSHQQHFPGHHEHDGEHDSGSCHLDLLITTSFVQKIQKERSLPEIIKSKQIYSISDIIELLRTSHSFDLSLKREAPYLVALPQTFLLNSYGLRAPPVA